MFIKFEQIYFFHTHIVEGVHPAIYFKMVFVINRLYFEFGTNVSVPTTSVRGGSMEHFKGNNMVYDCHNKFIGNIKNSRYTHLGNAFKKHYSIEESVDLDRTENTSISRLWYEELHRLIRRNAYKNKKNDLLKHTAIPTDVVDGFCEVLNLHNLENFSAFNVPIDHHDRNRRFVSKYDYCFGSTELTSQQYSFVNTSYSITNIKKIVKSKLSYRTTNQQQGFRPIPDVSLHPVRNVCCIPVLPNLRLDEIDNNIICIIPENSIVLNSSDYWYDIEYDKILNKYPIAICMFHNHVAQDIAPVTKCDFNVLELVVNKQLITNNISLKMNRRVVNPSYSSSNIVANGKEKTPSTLQQQQLILEKPNNRIENIYTDGSIRSVNGKATSGIGVWFESQSNKNVSQQIICPYDNDINFCELMAIYVAILNASPKKRVHIYTDSFTAMNLLKEGQIYGRVRNRKYHHIVMEILSSTIERNQMIKILKVKAHIGDVGNTNADLMARLGVYNTYDEPINVTSLSYRHDIDRSVININNKNKNVPNGA